MITINTGEVHNRVANERYAVAKECKYIAQDPSMCQTVLWHGLFCLHPSIDDHDETGVYEHCDLVWAGECVCGGIKE